MDNLTLIWVSIAAFVFIANLAICIWVYKDAKQKGQNAWLWVVLVIVTGNFGGLIIYLLIGRNQSNTICSKCNSATSSKGNFCCVCGEKIEVMGDDIMKNKNNKTWLIISITCIFVALLSIFIFIFAYFNMSGFQFERQFGAWQKGENKYVANLSQKSSGDTWELSFEESSEGYTVSKRYKAEEEPELITVETTSSNNGSVRIVITQEENKIEETIGSGKFDMDLSGFDEGKLKVEVINVDAKDFKGEILIKE